jgi:hypothetical protein
LKGKGNFQFQEDGINVLCLFLLLRTTVKHIDPWEGGKRKADQLELQGLSKRRVMSFYLPHIFQSWS